MKGVVASIALWCMIAVVVAEPPVSVPCNPDDMKPCGLTIGFGAPPTAECCRTLKDQRVCLCKYINDPRYILNPGLKAYLSGPYVKNAAAICKVTIPHVCPFSVNI